MFSFLLPLLSKIPFLGSIGKLFNQWTIVALVIGGIVFAVWYYKDEADQAKLDYAELVRDHDLTLERVKTLEEVRDKLKDAYDDQLEMQAHLQAEYNRLREEYASLEGELGNLNDYIDSLDEVLKASTPEQKRVVLDEATAKLNALIQNSYGCIEGSSGAVEAECQ